LNNKNTFALLLLFLLSPLAGHSADTTPALAIASLTDPAKAPEEEAQLRRFEASHLLYDEAGLAYLKIKTKRKTAEGYEDSYQKVLFTGLAFVPLEEWWEAEAKFKDGVLEGDLRIFQDKTPNPGPPNLYLGPQPADRLIFSNDLAYLKSWVTRSEKNVEFTGIAYWEGKDWHASVPYKKGIPDGDVEVQIKEIHNGIEVMGLKYLYRFKYKNGVKVPDSYIEGGAKPPIRRVIRK
jgi:hypothetical protein